MDLQLRDKTAVVTGSTAGIGLAIATTLSVEGAKVVVNGRTQERVDAAMAEIKQAAPDANLQGVAADLASAAGVEQLIEQVPQVEILVNNLGIFEAVPFGDIPDDEWLRFFEVNVLSGIRLSRHYMPAMMERNWGRIIFIASESALYIPAEMIHYGMTKTAQLSVARGLAETTVGTAVTVNSIMPGPTRSEGVEGFVRGLSQQQGISEEQVEKEFFSTMRPSSLLQRFIDPAEIAAVVAFVASPLASAINGAAVRAEGGLLRNIA